MSSGRFAYGSISSSRKKLRKTKASKQAAEVGSQFYRLYARKSFSNYKQGLKQ